MSTDTVFYIILSGIIALMLALFHYLYKTKLTQLKLLLSLVRFTTYFVILLLIINPKFVKTTYSNQKPNLVVAIDNSSSVKHLNQNEKVLRLLNQIQSNIELQKRFNIDVYSFSEDISSTDSISFKGKRTNIAKAFNNFKSIYRNSISPILLITDGNQTYGNDYEYVSKDYKQPINPVILGDTVTYLDLKIDQLNVNRYAFLNNRFPVETFVVYNGQEPVNTTFQVKSENSVVFSKPILLSKNNSSARIDFTLPANSVGVKTFKAQIVPVNSEKNTTNNSKEFAVDVMNQKTNIALVSDIVHPDLGTIKKSIEQNKQRTVSIIRPNDYFQKYTDFQLAILYQPNQQFKSVFDRMDQLDINYFLITGPKTDWNLLNSTQPNFFKNISNIYEDYQATLNENFATFLIDDFNFETFPPLKSSFEDVNFKVNAETLLFKTVNGFNTNQPLLSTFENNSRRGVVLFGEGLWKWRSQSFLNENSFYKFDDFIGKLIQYLTTNKNKSRLNVTIESFYNSNDDIVVSVQYFNKNFEFDPRVSLSIILSNKETGKTLSLPFILKNNVYQVDLSSLQASEYNYTIQVKDEIIKHTGSFKIIKYDVEQQFLNANVTKLKQVATNTKGNSYFIDNTSSLFEDLLKDSRYQTIQVSNKNTVPLIDFKWLLSILVFSLSIEWFFRKFNGLI